MQQAQKRAQVNEHCLDEAIYQLDKEIPEFDYQKGVVFCQHIDILSREFSCDNHSDINKPIRDLYDRLSYIDKQVLRLHQQGQLNCQSLELMDLAESYCWIISGLCALRFQLLNPQLSLFIPVVELYIQLILQRFDASHNIGISLYSKVTEILLDKNKQNQSLSFISTN